MLKKHMERAEATCPHTGVLLASSFNPPVYLDAKPNSHAGLPDGGSWETFQGQALMPLTSSPPPNLLAPQPGKC